MSVPDNLDPIRFVKLDYREFDDLSLTITTMCQSVNTWLQVTDAEVISYLHTCLEAYVVLNQQDIRNRGGRYDPAVTFLPSIIHIFKLPKYFKGIIREMARPMYDHEGIIYLPDIPPLDIDKFVDNTKLMIRSQIVKILGEDLKIPLFPIDAESIQPIQFAVYHDNSNEILSFDQLPSFRTKAQNALKHIRFQQILPLQTLDGNYQAYLEDDETVKVVDNLQELNNFTNPRFGFYYRNKIGKVQINGVPMVRTLHGFYNKPQDLVTDSGIKFPTEKPKSKKKKHKSKRSSKATTSSCFTSDAGSRYTTDNTSKYTSSSLDSPQTGGDSSSLNSIFNSSPIR